MRNLVDETMGQYRIVAKLGQGDLGEVYKAFQPGLNRYVSLKILHPHFMVDPEFVRRFRQEAAVIASLRHPHIVPVLDFDHADNLYYLVMEYIDGPTLKDEIKARQETNRPFAIAEIARIMLALCRALDYVHRRGLVHRDLKPSNVMIDQDGRVLLTDFGIARVMGATQYTTTGALAGTPAYMSPEQGQGVQGDERSDIYSLGVMLYELTTGRPPYQAETPYAVIIKHLSEPLPVPSQVNPQIPEAVERIILKALSKDPADRFQTAEEMTQVLQTAVGLSDKAADQMPVIVHPPQSRPAAPPVVERSARQEPPVSVPAALPPSPPMPPASLPSSPAPPEIQKPADEAPPFYMRAWEFVRRNLAPAGQAASKMAANPAPAALRLDAAVPDQVSLGRTFTLAVAVRQLASPTLVEDDLKRVRSGRVQVAWPKSSPSIQLRVQVSAPECQIHGHASHTFRLYAGQDSPVIYFHLAPQTLGEINIVVTIYQEENWLGSARVQTLVQEQVVGQVQLAVTSQLVTSNETGENDSLRRQLARHQANLLKLQEQAAMFGAGQTPLHLLNQIEAEQQAIAELETRLAAPKP